MKKYMIAMAALLLTAGMVNAQAAKKTSTNPTIKSSKHASTKKATASTATVTPAAPATENKASTPATIKRKHHKKTKSVPTGKN